MCSEAIIPTTNGKNYLHFNISGNTSAVDNYDFWGTSYMVCSPIEFSTVDPTGILNIESSPSNSLKGGEPCGEPEVWYNLSGQRVSKGYKGIVVVKGKKYVIN